MTAFTAMYDALFADPNMAVDADYLPFDGGPALACRVRLSQPTEVIGFNTMPIATDTTMIEVRKSQVPAPVAGDVFVLRDEFGLVAERRQVQGVPKFEALRIVWLLDTRPAV